MVVFLDGFIRRYIKPTDFRECYSPSVKVVNSCFLQIAISHVSDFLFTFVMAERVIIFFKEM